MKRTNKKQVLRRARQELLRVMANVMMLALGAVSMAWGAEAPAGKAATTSLAFQDADKDGVNDLFRDANGDGVDDVTKAPYKHQFIFVDADKDGVNDLFRDANGDGVNDIGMGAGAAPGRIRFLDADGDGINDVVVVREKVQTGPRFIDENGDGINDRALGAGARQRLIERAKGKDVFIDSDGDGINDGRGLSKEERQQIRKKLQERARNRLRGVE